MNPLQKLAGTLNRIDAIAPSRCAHPVFVAGVLYPSLFSANFESGIRSASIWKRVRRTGGGPVLIRGAFVVMEAWVTAQADYAKWKYQL